jgi:hypothetical protein
MIPNSVGTMSRMRFKRYVVIAGRLPTPHQLDLSFAALSASYHQVWVIPRS